MLKVKRLKNFKKDYSKYQRAIDNMPNETAKKKGYNLLNKLVEQYNYIDAAHDSDTSKFLDPKKIRDNIEKSIDLRVALDKLISDSTAL